MSAIRETTGVNPQTGELEYFKVAVVSREGYPPHISPKELRDWWKMLPWELVPTSTIYRYREYDKYDLRHPDDVEELAWSIAREGWREPLMLEYYQGNKRVLLGEGNHRLHAARLLGLTHVPVRVWAKRSSWTKSGKRSRVSRDAIAISNDFGTDEYIKQELHPSEIGIKNALRLKIK